MPFVKQIIVKCDQCGRTLGRDNTGRSWQTRPAGSGYAFGTTRDAIAGAEEAGWYADARTTRCPDCWPEGATT